MKYRGVLSAILLAACAVSVGCTEHVIGAVTKHQARKSGGMSPNGRDYCRVNHWYGDGTCDPWCPKHDEDCALDAGPAPCGPEDAGPLPDACCGPQDGGPAGEPCGPNVCAPGEVCCNESCGICTQPGEGCIELWCGPLDAGTCIPECPQPPPGCHYEGPISCDPHSCGTLVCDEDAGAPEKDCRTEGCPPGHYCDICWVGYACIPDGAVC